jgi:hypothetical protein
MNLKRTAQRLDPTGLLLIGGFFAVTSPLIRFAHGPEIAAGYAAAALALGVASATLWIFERFDTGLEARRQ